MRSARVALLAGILLAPAAFGHPAPNSIVRLEFRAGDVRAEYWIPVSELEYARAADPAGELPAYLLRHVSAQSADGASWRVAIGAVRETTYLDHPYLVAAITLTPPIGNSPRAFVLVDDAVTHEVRNHIVYVVAPRGAESAVLGALQYPERRLGIAAP